MELTVIVVDKYSNEISDKELKNKVIDIQAYYDLVLPIRKRINDELFQRVNNIGWKNISFML